MFGNCAQNLTFKLSKCQRVSGLMWMHGVRVKTTLLIRGCIVRLDRLTQSSAQEPDTDQPELCSIGLCITFSLKVSAVHYWTPVVHEWQHSTTSLKDNASAKWHLVINKNRSCLEQSLVPAICSAIHIDKVEEYILTFFNFFLNLPFVTAGFYSIHPTDHTDYG